MHIGLGNANGLSGASIYLAKKRATNSNYGPGGFCIEASNVDTSNLVTTSQLIGKPDGTLTWNGKQLSTVAIWRGTQAQYNALSSYDSNTIYIITAS